MSKISTCKAPKRKRGKTQRTTKKASGKKPAITEEAVDRVYRFVRDKITPQIFALIARKMGQSHIAPRDFYCGCAPSPRDGTPICEGKKPDCRFAGCGKVDETTADFTAEEEARFARLRSKAISRLEASYNGNIPGQKTCLPERMTTERTSL